MERQGDEVHVNTSEARGGSTPHIVRYILAISLLLTIIALSAIWITGAMNSAQPEPNDGVSRQATPES